MNIVIKNQSNSIIATARVGFDSELKTAAKNSSDKINKQTRHSVQYLSKVVQLIKGQKYYVEYSAVSGAGFRMAPAIENRDSLDRNLWKNGRAKQSTDSGKNWKSLNTFPDSDLPMYLIPVGIPTKTPMP